MDQIPVKLYNLPPNFIPFSKAVAMRDLRNKLLAKVDIVNPVWYASLSAQQQGELTTYRRALLDVPQQTGFPDTISWPSKPSWLG
jgi:hypothetical protein